MSYLRTKTRVLDDRTYRHVGAECRRNQFFLLKRRPQNIVLRLEHRFHEVTSSGENVSLTSHLSALCFFYSFVRTRREIIVATHEFLSSTVFKKLDFYSRNISETNIIF